MLSAVFSPDGTKIVTASADDTAQLWDVKVSFEATYVEAKQRLEMLSR